MQNLKPLVVILGPTASGKTGLAWALARKFGGELLSADSRQIYRGMDIATNKLSAEKTTKEIINGETVYFIDGIPLYLLDLIDPDQNFSLTDYKKMALAKIEEIQSRNKLPILVGGTGLYLSAIVDNLDIPPAPQNDSLRQAMEKREASELFRELEQADPQSAATIGPHNKRKLIRALEVYKLTGKSFSSQQTKGAPLFDFLQLGITTDRQELYRDIDARVDAMMASGLLEETERLRDRYDPALPAMSGIGYKELGTYLQNDTSLEEAVQKIKFHTHQYSRRQMTWFKKDARIHWISNYQEAEDLVEKFTR